MGGWGKGADLPLVHALWKWRVLGFHADRDPVDSDRGVLVVEDVVGGVVDVGGVAYLLGAEIYLLENVHLVLFSYGFWETSDNFLDERGHFT